MNTFNLVLNIIYLFVGCGALGYVGTYLHKHHKANRLANGLEVAQKFANMSVARIATDSNLAMGQRRTAVVRELQEVLDSHGYHFDVKRLVGLAQATYNVYKANGHKIVQPKPTPAPTVDNTTDGPQGHIEVKQDKSAEYVPSNKLSDDEINVLNHYREQKAAQNK